MRSIACAIVWVALAAGTAASGDSLTAVDTGWYLQRTPVAGGSPTYQHLPANQSFAAGTADVNLPTFIDEYRNFFLFDLSTLTTPVVSAVLRIQTYTYSSVDPSETIALYDVTTPTATLTSGSSQASTFADLGSGTTYGSRVYTMADEGSYRDIPLNAAAIAAINASLGGDFALGGALTTLSFDTSAGAGDELLFANYSSAFDQFLVFETVPEPSTAALLGLGLAWTWLSVRRRRMH